jgi:hypothetical protein
LRSIAIGLWSCDRWWAQRPIVHRRLWAHSPRAAETIELADRFDRLRCAMD